MDIGASTGGFTDCMLQNGAVKGIFCRCRIWTVCLETYEMIQGLSAWKKPISVM